MSYGASAALQGAVYQCLLAHQPLTDLIGDAVYDAMPVEAPAGVYVALGPEQVSDAGDMTARGARHDFVVSVIAGRDESVGFAAVKRAAGAVADALETGAMALARGHLAGLWFVKARAARVEKGAARRVDLTFRARIDLG